MNIQTSKKWDKLIAIGHLSVYFGLLILTLRHFFIYPANHYNVLLIVMLVGFLPSFLYKLAPARLAPYILVINALAVVSFVFIVMREWALAGVFLLVPVFSLLFQERRFYLFASVCSLLLNVVLAVLFLFDSGRTDLQLVTLLDVLTVFIILVFIIYLVVKDLKWSYTAEAKSMQTILTLSQSVEAKDAYTQGHSERVAYLGRLFADEIHGLDAETVYNCGLIHDVGKLAIPDSILTKPSRLTDDELQIMKSHTTNGVKICRNLNVSQEIVDGVLHHHERWDGKGYPQGLQGEHIPLIGRVLCLADSIDAMCSNRAYRRARDLDTVLQEIKACSGLQFDPKMVRIVVEKWPEVERFYKQNEK